jgi:hypothetical protein
MVVPAQDRSTGRRGGIDEESTWKEGVIYPSGVFFSFNN